MPDFALTKTNIELMQKACLLCDNSTLDVKTGCLAYLGGQVVATGWNHNFLETVVHAEMALLDDATRNHINLASTDLYTTRFPCEDCALMLIAQKISTIYYMSNHFTSDNAASGVLLKSGIKLIQIEESTVWGK